MKVGEKFEHEFSISQEEVNQFASLSGDNNPIHLDPEYAKDTVFKKPVIHGVFTLSVFSKILGTLFPGEGSIYLGQEIQFKRPMYPGEKYKAVVELKEVNEKRHIGSFSTEIFSTEGKITVSGVAQVKHDVLL